MIALLLEEGNVRRFMVDSHGFLQLAARVKAPAVNTLCTTVPTDQIELWNKLHIALTDENGINKQYNYSSHSAEGVRSAQEALEKLLASKEYSALDDLSRIFGWKFPYEYPVPFSRAAVNKFASQYVQASTGLIDQDNLIVCKLTPKMVDGCVSIFTDADGYGEVIIDCETDGPISAQVYSDYARGWVTSASTVIESVLGLVIETFSAGNAAMSLMSQYLDEVYSPKNLTYPFRPSLAEMLCLITGPISINRSENTSMHQVLMPEDNHKLPFNESVQVAVEFSTYRSTGSVQKWQYILYVPLVSLCIQSAIVLIYLVAVLRCKRLRDVAEPQYLFQIGLATPFGKATNAEGIDQKFGGRWAVAKDGNNMHVAQPVQRRRLVRLRGRGDRAPSYRQANQGEPKDLEEGGDGVARRVSPVRKKGFFEKLIRRS
ncbi:DASH complex subunit ask1 [Ascosphaera pollenicola]|nr:DASH complex subunit ask1 [Ascosphaera pollenicola]